MSQSAVSQLFYTSTYRDLQNGPNTIDFAQPVSEFTAIIQRQSTDPSDLRVAVLDGGNTLLLDTTSADIVTVRVPGIRKARVYARTTGLLLEADSVVFKRRYQLSFRPDSSCPPSGDEILDSKQVRDQLREDLEQSLPNDPPQNRKERGGLIYKMQDGTFRAFPQLDPYATGCTFHPNYQVVDPVGAMRLYGFYHTHPQLAGEPVYGCAGTNLPQKADPDANGGGSDADWEFANLPAVKLPVYAITKRGRVYRMDPGVPVSARGSNPNRWQSTGPGCLKKP